MPTHAHLPFFLARITILWLAVLAVLGAAELSPQERSVLADFGNALQEHAQGRGNPVRLETLARERRGIIRRLVSEDPAQAVALRLNRTHRAQVPPGLQSLLEEEVSTKGRLDVVARTDGTVIRTLSAGGRTYQVNTYGRRLAVRSGTNIHVQGVAVDGVLALSDSPLRVLAKGEPPLPGKAQREQRCPVSGKAAGSDQEPEDNDSDVVVESGDTVYYLCSAGHIGAVEGSVSSTEAAMVPVSSAWTTGAKTVLLIRVRFADQAADYEPISVAGCDTMMTGTNNFFVANSFGATSMTWTTTPVYTLPQTQSWYQTDNGSGYYMNILQAARDIAANPGAVAANAGLPSYQYTSYTFEAVLYNGPGGFGGQGFVGARGVWLKSFSAGVSAHEFGHNYGVWHANSWNPSGNTAIGAGSHQEYGNSYDTMGSANAGNWHFNANFKNILDWLPSTGVWTAASGTTATYRIHAQDVGGTIDAAKKYAIKVPTGVAQKDYWIEYRSLFASNTWTSNGAMLLWGDAGTDGASRLLDTTPQSASGKNDAAIAIGRTWSDPAQGIHITPVAKITGTPNAIDVVVNRGTFPGNRPPTISVDPSAWQVATGQVVTFTLTASDPDGDTLAVHWDFGDNTFTWGTSAPTKSWSTAKEYPVRVSVSDMKGGVASDTLVIRVGAPTSTGRIAGRVLWGGRPVSEALVTVGTIKVLTEADGSYIVPGLAAGSYTVTCASEGLTYTSQFTNPVSLADGQAVYGIDFRANEAYPDPTAVTTYTVSGSVTDNSVGVSGATVWLAGKSTTTAANGTWSISGVPNGSWTVTATKPGLVFSSATITVSGANYTGLTLIRQYATISGIVNTASTGVSVTVRAGGYSVTGLSAQQGNGKNAPVGYPYSLTVPFGTYTVVASAANLIATPTTWTNPVVVGSGGASARDFNTASSTARYQIRGTVTVNGRALAGVAVATSGASAITGPDGVYVLGSLAAGTYTVTPTISGGTFSPATRSVTLTAADATAQDFSLSDAVPTVATAAAANPTTVSTPTGSTALSVLGADNAGEASLTYTWSATTAPFPVSFSANGTNAAKNSTAVFQGPGSYVLQVTIADAYAQSVTSSVSVTVNGSSVSNLVTVSPYERDMIFGDSQQYTATVWSATGSIISATPVWSTNGGSITTGGLYQATTAGSTYTITATATGSSGVAYARVLGSANPTVVAAVGDATASEPALGLGVGTVVFTRNIGTGAVTINYSVSGTATAGSDYQTLSGSVSMADGQTSATVTITPLDDAVVEGHETVILTVIAGTGYNVGASTSGTVTIKDDEPCLVTISATDNTAAEPGATGGNGVFRLTRAGNPDTALTVNLSVGGTASGSDYTGIGGTAVIAGGATTVDLTLVPVNDGESEDTETATLAILTGSGYTSGSPSSASVTILDDDANVLVVSVTDSDCAEASSNDGIFTITRLGLRSSALTFTYAMSGTAGNGSDYQTRTGSASINANANTTTISVDPIDDALYEGPETAILTVTVGAGYSVGAPSSDTVTIVDNDKPTVSIAATDAAADEGGGTATFTISRTGITSLEDLTVLYAVSGTATAGGDYQSLTGTVTIPMGQPSATVTIVPLQDQLIEVEETVILTISTNTAYIVATSPANAATATIVDDTEEPMLTVTATDSTASEPGFTSGNGVFTITRAGSPVQALTVNLVMSGTATAGSDYTSLGGNVVIPAGATSAVVTLVPLDDAEAESDETAVLTLQSGSGYTIGGASSATVNIYDDEPVQIIAEILDGDCGEAATPNQGSFTLRRLGLRSAAVTVSYAISGTATSFDHSTVSGSTTIAANGATATISVVPIDDVQVEGTETVILTVTAGSGYAVGTPNAVTLNLKDDEVVDVTISTPDANCSEPADSGSFRLTRSAASAAALTVNYVMTGTATNGSDYTTVTGSAIIAANATSVDVLVTPIDDTAIEGGETVIMTITLNGAQYDIGNTSAATIVLRDNDAPTITVAATDSAAAEGGDTGTFTLTASPAPAANLTVGYIMSGSAGNGVDYGALSGTVVIPAGQTSVTVVLTPVDDQLGEGSETAIFTLSSGSGYSVGTTNTATVTIAASDTPVATITAVDPDAAETGPNTGRFQISLSNPATGSITVAYAVSGSATPATDYTALTGTLSIAAGSVSGTITVTPLNDAVTEGSETVIATLSSGTGYTVGTPSSATVNIADDGANPTPTATIVATDGTADETGSATGTYTVTLSSAPTTAVTVNLTYGGTATSVADYGSLPASVTIPAGSTTAVVVLTPVDDALYEGSETAIATIGSGTGYLVGTPSSATITITDNDSAPTVTITATDAAAAESPVNTGTFQVSLSAITGVATTVNLGYSGSALASADYATLAATVTIPAGSTTATLTVTPVNDTVFEGNETVIATIAAGAGYGVGSPASATVTIGDDDSAPVATITATDAAAAEPGTDTGAFTVTLSNAAGSGTVVSLAVAGTATSASDYTAIPVTVTVPAGSTSALITVTPIDDTIYEGSETIIVTVNAGTGYTVGSPSSATVTITDNESVPAVSITAADPTATESPLSTGTCTITLSVATTTDLVVNLAASGTATGGTDYTALPASVTVPAGSTTASITVVPINDAIFEGSETVIASIATGTGYAIGNPSSATVTIADDETPPTASIAATLATAPESSVTDGQFTITLSAVSGSSTTVNLTISGTATNGTDCTTIAGSVVIPAGASSATVDVSPIDDTIFEGSETVIATVAAGSGYGIGAPSAATVTITDDDSAPTASITANDPSAAESPVNTGSFTVTLSNASSSVTTVALAISGTATAGSDYATIPASVSVPAGSLTTAVLVTPVDDAVSEGSETVIATISSGSGYAVGTPSSATVTIADNEGSPVVSIAATDDTATESPLTTATFTLTVSPVSSSALTINLSAAGTATSGTDYTALATTVTIAAGASSATVTVSPIDDAVFEGNETVIATVGSGAGYTVGTASASATIIDNESAPVATIAASDGAASEPGANTGSFTVTLSAASASATTINLTVSGTATSGSDYTSLGASVTIPAGQTSAVITVAPLDDATIEPTETVIAALAAGTGYTVGTPSSATVTIADDEAGLSVTITATDASATEGGDTGAFTVTLSATSATATTVNLSVAGTATSGSDYTALPVSVTIPAGSTTAVVTLTPVNDTLYELAETVVATVAAGSGYTVGTPSSATVTINDNDAVPTVTIAATDAAATEAPGNTGIFTVTLTPAAGTPTIVNLAAGGTAGAGSDYTTLAATVTIPAGSTSATVTVTPIEDTIYEGSETVIATVSAGTGYAVGGSSTATVTITDNDAVPTISISATDASAVEQPANTGTFTLTLSNAASAVTTVNLSAGGTAAAGSDYTALGATVSIPAGATSATVTVTPLDDGVYEGSETVIATIGSGSGYAVGTPSSATVTIADDESAPLASVSASDATAAESPLNTGTFTVTLSGASSAATVVNLTVAGTATNGVDCTAIGATLTIPSGQTSGTVTVTPVDDAIFEGSETVIATIAAGTGYGVGSPSSATVTISDDDGAPTATITASDAAASEPGSDTGTFTVTLSNASSSATTVNLSVGGSASAGVDYTALAGTVVIPAGSLSATVTVTPIDDGTSESPETVIVTLSTGTGYGVGTPASATVTINDNDGVPVVTLQATDAAASETGSGTGTWTVTLSAAQGSPLTISLSYGGSAGSGDYGALPATVTIAAGATTATVTVVPVDDAIFEGAETVIASLVSGSGYAVGSPSTGTVTISDNESAPTASVTATDAAAAESPSDSGVVTITLSGASGAATVVNITVGGSAASGSDYTAVGTTVTIPAGSTSATVSIAPIDDAIFEGSETVIVGIATGTGYGVGSPSSATVSIADNETAPIATILATDASAVESPTGVGAFTVTLSGASSSATTVNLTYSGTATAASDYSALAGSVSIPAGSLSASVTVTPLNDAIYEGSETVIASLAAGTGYSVGAPSTDTVTIADDESQPLASITATDAVAAEPTGNPGVFTVTLSGTSSVAVSVNLTVTGTATSGSDYTALATSVSIPAGSTSATVTVTVIDDLVTEGSETVIAALSAGTGYTVDSPSSATVTIADNEGVPTATITASDPTAAESPLNTGTFTVTLSSASASSITVSFTVGGSATAGSDYTALASSVTIPAGSTSATLTVTPIDDAIFEGSETVTASLTAGTGYAVGTPGSATVTISDNETAPVVTIAATDANASEPGADTGLFTVSLSPVSATATTVNLTYGGSATAGSDYSALAATVTIPAGSSSATVQVTVINDAVAESAETVIATVAVGTGYSVGTPSSATVTIADDEGALTATIAAGDPTATESPVTTGAFTITLSGAAASPITIALSASGTATASSDYTALAATVTIPAGQTTATVLVTPVNDAIFEGSETVIATITAGSGYVVGGASSATVTITDDETAPSASITATDATATESPVTTGTFTVSLSGASATPTTVNLSVSGTATVGTDCLSLPANVVIPAGTTSVTITVTPVDDVIFEGSETVIMTVAAGTGYTVGAPSSGTVTITDNEAAPTATISATDATASESPLTTGTVTVTLSVASTTATVVQITVNGSATAGADFASLGTSVTIPAGQTTATITVTPVDDAIFEGAETVVVGLAAGSGYAVGAPSTATVTIADDETTPSAAIAVTDGVCSEAGPDSGSFQITLSTASSQAVTVVYSLSGKAVNGTDYATLNGWVLIPAGATSANIVVNPINDSKYEKSEPVTATIDAGTGYVIDAASVATLNIADDDGLNQPGGSTLAISPAPSSGTSSTYSAPTNAQDPGTLQSTWNWGDGTISSGVVGTTSVHVYGAAGTYTVTVTIVDPTNGQTLVESFTVTVGGLGGGGGGTGVKTGGSGGGGGCGMGSAQAALGLLLALLLGLGGSRRRR